MNLMQKDVAEHNMGPGDPETIDRSVDLKR